ncbi:hypothetical protein OGAPHI_001243 [Ogataea philodendri]|uniref:DUF155 domain-containing protein n=1 Tax=Ogataea philodendri TaxID=1378263 RepID=A0A9P8T8W6_9ASCO|nr:uncharacterized protein OGAPHI_001243 [Ogataea philodendri]KAH3670728.1 hypothetical protein OGAPHI_001243 [Ogataea philodendri]
MASLRATILLISSSVSFRVDMSLSSLNLASTSPSDGSSKLESSSRLLYDSNSLGLIGESERHFISISFLESPCETTKYVSHGLFNKWYGFPPRFTSSILAILYCDCPVSLETPTLTRTNVFLITWSNSSLNRNRDKIVRLERTLLLTSFKVASWTCSLVTSSMLNNAALSSSSLNLPSNGYGSCLDSSSSSSSSSSTVLRLSPLVREVVCNVGSGKAPPIVSIMTGSRHLSQDSHEEPHGLGGPQRTRSSTAKRSPSILVTDARKNQIKAPFAGHKQERIKKSGQPDRVSPPAWVKSSSSKQRRPVSMTKFSDISVSNIISNISDIPSSRQRELPRNVSPNAQYINNLSRSGPRMVPQYYKTLPTRTSKTSQKLVLIPDHDQVPYSIDDDEAALLRNHEIGEETTTDNIFNSTHVRTKAEKLSKEQRADVYPRVTAYLISEGFNLNLTSKFLSKYHMVSPRLYDEALYVPYTLPLLPGDNGYRVQSNNSAKMQHGNQLLENFLDKTEQRDHHYEFYSGQDGDVQSIGSPKMSPAGSLVEEQQHNNEFDPYEPQFFVSSSPTDSMLLEEEARDSDSAGEAEKTSKSSDTSAIDDTESSDRLEKNGHGTRRKSSTSSKKRANLPDLTKHAEMFVLDYGVVVFWNFTEIHEKNILADLVFAKIQPGEFELDDDDDDDQHDPSFPNYSLTSSNSNEEQPQTPVTFIVKPVPEHNIETEEFHFEYISDIPTPRIYNDMITLKSGDHLIKLTVSHAIAQSTKLSMFESKMSNILNSISRLPKALALTGKLQNYTRQKLLIKTGKLFQLRNEVNLSSNVLDKPEYFWTIEPGLDPLYSAIREYLEIDQRVEVINDRCKIGVINYLSFGSVLVDALSVWNSEEHKTVVGGVESEVSLSFELDHVAHLQVLDVDVGNGLGMELGLWSEEVLKVVTLVQFVLGDQMVKVHQVHMNKLVGSKPGQLLAGLSEISVQVQSGLDLLHQSVLLDHLVTDNVTPVHEGDLLAVGNGLGVLLLQQKIGREVHLLGSNVRILLVLRSVFRKLLFWTLRELHVNKMVLGKSSVSWSNWINHLLVGRPNDVPVQVDNVLGWTLRDHKVPQSLNTHTSSSNTSDSWESWVVPVRNVLLVNKPLQLSLGKQGSDKVDSGKIPNVHLSQVQSLQNPLVLDVSVSVLDSSQCVSDSLYSINNRNTEVVSRVHLPLGTSTVVRSQVASVDNRVSQSLVQSTVVNLGSQTVLQTFLGTVLHLFSEHAQVLLNGSISSGRLDTVHSFGSHLLQRSVVTVRLSFLDHLDGKVVHLIEIIGRIGDLVTFNAQQLQIFQNGVLELDLLLGRIGIVESDDQLSVVGLGEILVQQSSLSVTNVEVSRRFRRESGNDLAVLCVWKIDLEVGLVGLLLGSSLGSLSDLGQRFGQQLNNTSKSLVRFQVLVPSGDVDVDSVLQNRSHHGVGTQSSPSSDVGNRGVVANNERSQTQMGVQFLQINRKLLEVLDGEVLVSELNPRLRGRLLQEQVRELVSKMAQNLWARGDGFVSINQSQGRVDLFGNNLVVNKVNFQRLFCSVVNEGSSCQGSVVHQWSFSSNFQFEGHDLKE